MAEKTAEKTAEKDPKLMTLSEVQAELERLAQRRKVLLKVERLICELHPLHHGDEDE